MLSILNSQIWHIMHKSLLRIDLSLMKFKSTHWRHDASWVKMGNLKKLHDHVSKNIVTTFILNSRRPTVQMRPVYHKRGHSILAIITCFSWFLLTLISIILVMAINSTMQTQFKYLVLWREEYISDEGLTIKKRRILF